MTGNRRRIDLFQAFPSSIAASRFIPSYASIANILNNERPTAERNYFFERRYEQTQSAVAIDSTLCYVLARKKSVEKRDRDLGNKI